MATPTLHAFLRDLAGNGTLRLDLRAVAAVETLLEHADRDPSWSSAEVCAAITSLLARSPQEWDDLHQRLIAFLQASRPQPPASPPTSHTDMRPDAGPGPPPPLPRPLEFISQTAPEGRQITNAAEQAARIEHLRRRILGLPVWGWLLALGSVALAILLILGTIAAVRWYYADAPPPSEPPAKERPAETQVESTQAEQKQTEKPDRDPKPVERQPAAPTEPAMQRAMMLALWLVTVPLAFVGLHWLRAKSMHLASRAEQHRRSLQLRRMEADDDDANVLTYAVERTSPLPLAVIDDTAVILGRIGAATVGDDLDIRATLDATARAGGRFAPVHALVQRQQRLTVLVDGETGAHPFLHAILHVLARWHQLGVKIDRYDFKHRPRFVESRPVEADDELGSEVAPRIDLDALARRTDGTPLLIVTRMAELAEKTGALPWLHHLSAWPRRAVLDLDPRPLDEPAIPPSKRGPRRGVVPPARAEAKRVAALLAEAGTPRFPFTREGLAAMALHLAHDARTTASEPTLRPWQDLVPALRRWAALAACVPDPTWDQLEAFRRSFSDLAHALPDPGYVQRLLDWLRSQKEDPISSDGKRLAISPQLLGNLLQDLRTAEAAAPGEVSATEHRARTLIIRQLTAALPRSQPMSRRRALRLAFHRAVLEPARADDLLFSFVGTPEEPELQAMLAAHIDRLGPGCGAAWRTLRGRMIPDPYGPIPLRFLIERPFATRAARPSFFVVAVCAGVAWSGLAYDTLWPSFAAPFALFFIWTTLHAGAPRAPVIRPPNIRPPTPMTDLLDTPPTGGVVRVEAGRVLLSGGEFTMGDDAEYDEGPRRRVFLAPFEIATTPVTRFEWHAVVGGPPPLPDTAELPKTGVSWTDALAYLNALSRRSGLTPCYRRVGSSWTWIAGADGFRLPTEAEWEYAAHAGRVKPEGVPTADVGWCEANSSDAPQPIARRSANAWGLHDMVGNVWEWVWDAYGQYPGDSERDPTGPDGNGPVTIDDEQDTLSTPRVLRGGSFTSHASELHATARLSHGATSHYRDVGLRIARTTRPTP